MLRLDDVWYMIDGHALVAGITTSVRNGIITAIVGPNGAGKTTLLQQLGGICRPSRGHVLLDESDLARLQRREIAQHIAFLPQETNLEFAFSVHEVVMMGRNPHLGRFTAPSEHDQTVVSTALRRVGVAHLRNRVFTSLSGGERQRVLVARCLATEAPVLVLDEPTANLDIGHALALFDLLHELADDGATVVVAAHDLNLAMRYAGRCIVLDDGHVVADDDTLEALSSGVLQTVFRVDVTVLGTAGDRPVLAFSTRTPAVTEVYR